MKTKHTPGEWKVKHSESKDAFNVIGTNLGERYKIARVPCNKFGNPIIDERDKLEANSNATLIASAPDMLAMLQELIAHKTFASHLPTTALKVQALIKKATGDE